MSVMVFARKGSCGKAAYEVFGWWWSRSNKTMSMFALR
jgi:hypothetical protein